MRRNAGQIVVLSLGLALLVLATPFASWAGVLPYELKIEKVLDSTAELGDLAQAPDGELWLLERTTGVVRVFKLGMEAATLTIPVDNTCESGLLGVAFAPEYTKSGRSFVYYVDPAGAARVDTLFRTDAGLALGTNVLSLGTTASGCRPGGGVEIGSDGRLYVSVGDLGVSTDAQSGASLAGKVLRAELDGSVPVDNASGTLVWASGFRNGTDLSVDRNGQLFVADAGLTTAVSDEVNAVFESGNFGWDIVSGNSGGVYADPIVAELPTVGYRSLVAMTGEGLGADAQDSLVYACDGADEMRQARLSGTTLDQQLTLYDPDGDTDGTPDAGCPDVFASLTEGRDGFLYGANHGANPGIWRIWKDTPGTREVSPPGSPFHLTVDKQGSALLLGWERLSAVEVGRPKRNAGQPKQDYLIWEGTLPFTGYDHALTQFTDGDPAGTARRSFAITPGSGSRYYLVSGQADNLSGNLGSASDGTPRPGEIDYCETIGYGPLAGGCAEVWVNPNDGSELKLTDYNPNSPTYLQQLGMSDFRGRVLKIDISADNCVFCNLMADYHHLVDEDYRGRDLTIVTVLTLNFNGLVPIAPGSCQSVISSWASSHGEATPILCDTDLDANGVGDVSLQYWDGPGCGGTPQNIYVDQGNVIYTRICGGQLSEAEIATVIAPEVNPETCE